MLKEEAQENVSNTIRIDDVEKGNGDTEERDKRFPDKEE